jgi:serine/threonine protein kinase
VQRNDLRHAFVGLCYGAAVAFPRPYGRYILEDRLAMGGMAEIFRARTATAGFDKRVCIKRVLPHFLEDDDFVTMFRDEAKTAARLQHANVVQVFDFGEVTEDGQTTLFLAMELVEGLDLRKLADASRKKNIPFTVGEVAQIGIEMCRGLHHAHTLKDEGGALLGLVHRDISPHNVLISKQGEVKITDFGIAKAAERATHTSTGIVKGKVAYMSPEQAEGKHFDHRLDQWATGVVLWELLCGGRLFRGDNDATILRKVLNVEVPLPTVMRNDVPADFERIILRALAGEPEGRFADMRQMELALSRFLFSGAVDPSTTEVRSCYARIIDNVAASEPRRTNILPAADVAPRSVPAPTTIARDEQGATVEVQGGSSPSILVQSSPSLAAAMASANAPSDESQVFAVSERVAAAPGPLEATGAGTQNVTRLVEDAASLEQAVRTFDERSARQTPAPRDSLRPTASPTSPPERSMSNRAAPVTLLNDGDLAAAAAAASAIALSGHTDSDSLTADPEEAGTPATRTLVPASESQRNVVAPAPVTAPTGSQNRVSDADDVAVALPRSRTPLYAAGVLSLGAVAAVVIAMGASRTDAPSAVPVPVVAAPPPAETPPAPTPAPTPPTVSPPVAEPVAAVAEPAAPQPTPVVSATPATPTPATTAVSAKPALRPAKPTAPTAAPAATPSPGAEAAAVEPQGPPGSIYVDVPGGWATVSVGKRVFGETPLTVTLPAGKYTLTLEGGDGRKKNVPVTVVAGKKIQLREPL